MQGRANARLGEGKASQRKDRKCQRKDKTGQMQYRAETRQGKGRTKIRQERAKAMPECREKHRQGKGKAGQMQAEDRQDIDKEGKRHGNANAMESFTCQRICRKL